MFVVIVVIGLVAIVLAQVQPRWDRNLAWMVGVTLAVVAGVRSGGFDHEEYVWMIESLRDIDRSEIFQRIIVAKDPLFLLVVDAAALISADLQLVFVLIAAISVWCKVSATRVLPGKRTMFIALYAIFISPGLEFAAIRSGLALGFLLLVFVSTGMWRWLIMTISIAGHTSAVVPSFGILFRTYPRVVAVMSIIVLPVALQPLLMIAAESARYDSYFQNVGTVNALVFPLITAIGACFMLPAITSIWRTSTFLVRDMTFAAALCLGASCVLALPSVIVSYRLLELSWPLMAFLLLIIRTHPIPTRARVMCIATWVILFGSLVASNILRSTWVILLPFGGR